MVGFNYFAMELLKIIVGCGLLVLVGYFLEKNNRIIAIILGLLSLLYFTEVSFAETCSELTKRCEAQKAWYDERIALQTKNGWAVETNYVQCDLQTPPDPPGSKSRFIQYVGEYGANNYVGSCALDPEKCSIPKVKVGMEANGVDEKCACPSGTSSMDISYFNSDYSGSTDYLKKTHGKVGVCGSPPEGSKTPGRTDEQCCVSNLGCADGYKPDPTGAFIPTSPMATACVLDVPSCPEGSLMNPYGSCTRLKGDEANAPECANGDYTSSWKPQLNDSSSTQYHLDIVHSADGTGSRVRTGLLKCRCTSGKYRMKDYMEIVSYSDGSSQDRSNFIPEQAALCVVPSSSPSDPSSPEDSDGIPDSTSPESPEDMTFPDIPPYMTCKDTITGVTGGMVCKSSDGSSPDVQMYCADTQKYEDDPSSIQTVCYSGDAIAKAANTACQDGKTAYLVSGRWQCSSTPPPIESMSNPEQGCPAGTVQTSICDDWQCLPPSYRLPASLDCKAPVGTGTSSTGSNTGTGSSNSGTSTTTATTTSADGKTTTITNTTNIDTKGLQQDSTGKQTNQLLSSISGKQNAIADNTAKSAASDAQIATNTNKIAGDASKMSTSLSNIDGKLGGTGKTFSDKGMPDLGNDKLYKTEYKDGFGGVWEKRKTEIMATPIMKSLLPSVGFLPSGGSCPAFIFPKMTMGQTVYFEDISFPPESLCWIWDVKQL